MEESLPGQYWHKIKRREKTIRNKERTTEDPEDARGEGKRNRTPLERTTLLITIKIMDGNRGKDE